MQAADEQPRYRASASPDRQRAQGPPRPGRPHLSWPWVTRSSHARATSPTSAPWPPESLPRSRQRNLRPRRLVPGVM